MFKDLCLTVNLHYFRIHARHAKGSIFFEELDDFQAHVAQN
jgi:hypothetical protein